MSESFKLELINNHLIAYCNGKLILIDSGCEDSCGEFQTDSFGTINRPGGVMGGTIPLSKISSYVGYPLDGVLGMKLLETVNFTINLKEERLTFFQTNPKTKGVSIPLEQFLRIPIIPVTIEGKSFNAFLDAGAQISYVDQSLVDGLLPLRHQRDFHPLAGWFETPIYRKELVLGGEKLEMEVGILPDSVATALSFARIPIIVGIDLLKIREVTFIFKGGNKKIILRNFQDKESKVAI